MGHTVHLNTQRPSHTTAYVSYVTSVASVKSVTLAPGPYRYARSSSSSWRSRECKYGWNMAEMCVLSTNVRAQ